MERVNKTRTEWGVCTLVTDSERYYLTPPPPLDRPTARPGGEWGSLTELDAGLKRRHGDGIYRQAACFPGEYHPRIWRGSESPLPEQAGIARAFIESLLICNQMAGQLTDLFYHIHPEHAHFGVYGHRQRELLLLACTELESAWRGIYIANQTAPSASPRLTTNDYVKLNAPMRLSCWSVQLVQHPQLGALRPFQTWDATRPTASIVWYDAYNAVKHDRENSMQHATLGHAISAIAAVHIMIAAQFGLSALMMAPAQETQPFRLIDVPDWPLEEYYTRPMTGHGDRGSVQLGHPRWTPKPLGL